ncbi:DNA repair protein RAD16 like [Verticillium longisporum]|uniref:DNA repair protein RAD16 like n=1 Tax=Verticillium longisporum TaxID=100787 RepID=A0A8I3AI32_VERLO|nr:DNA repair protein RAD16 like [Verticillium longisporum]
MAPRKTRTSAAHSLASRTETPESSRSRRMTRSTSTQNLSSAVSPPPVDAIEPLSVAVRGSKSTTSASTSATFTSASEASTPATSHEVTPAPPAADEKSASSRPMMSRLEVQIPVMERAPSERATRNTRFSLARASKRSSNTYEVLDSDEDELSFDTSPDEIIARRLQKEEPSKSPLSASIERPTKKQKFIDDSEDDALSDDANGQASSSDLSEALSIKTDSDDFEAPEETGEDDSSDDMVEVARPRFVAQPKKRRPAQPNAPQGFRSAATLPILPSSEPDDDDFDPDRSDEELPELADASARINLDDSHDFVLGRRARHLEARPAMSGAEAVQPTNITRQLKPFQLKGVAWMKEMETTDWKGGLLGDEMGLGKTLQSVSLIMSDHGSIKKPSLVLVPPVALMQWTNEIASYTDGTLKTFVFHGTNTKVKNVTAKELKKYDVIMMSYNSLESMFRKQEKGFNQRKKGEVHKQKSIIHQIDFHRIILDEAHYIKGRDTGTARACIALKGDYRWCLTGTPLQNRIGELFSLVRFLNITPFASYLCKQCKCSQLEWNMDEHKMCNSCGHSAIQHVSVFNQEILNPIIKYGAMGPGAIAFKKLRLITSKFMLRRLKKDHMSAMDLPVKEININREFFSEVENDFARSIMTNTQRQFDTLPIILT